MFLISFTGDNGLFFTVYPRDRITRPTVARLALIPIVSSSCRYSSSVQSGYMSTKASNAFSCSGEIARCRPPRWGLGSIDPVSRYNRFQRLTVASPMPNRFANSEYVRFSVCHASTTRFRKSIDKLCPVFLLMSRLDHIWAIDAIKVCCNSCRLILPGSHTLRRIRKKSARISVTPPRLITLRKCTISPIHGKHSYAIHGGSTLESIKCSPTKG